MFTPNILLFYLSFIYSVLLLIASTIIAFRINQKKYTLKFKISRIIFIAFILRLFAIFLFPFGSGYDIDSFLWAGQTILNKQDIYWGLNVRYHFSFLPTFSFISAFSIWLSKVTPVPAYIVLKLIISIFDALIPFIIYKISKKKITSFLYAISPIPIILSAYFGQFDAIVLFFLLLCFYFFQQKKYFNSFFFLGISFAFKPWPIIFIPFMLLKSKSYRLFLAFFIIPSIVLLFYKLVIPNGDLITMAAAIIAYESAIGWWGPGILFKKLAFSVNKHSIIPISGLITKIVTVLILIYISIKEGGIKMLKRVQHDNNIYVLTKLLFLTVYIFSFGLGIQYLLWIFPFALLTNDKFTKYYILFVGLQYCLIGIFVLLTYNFIPPGIPQLIQDAINFSLWIFLIFWGIYQYNLQRKNNLIV